MKSKDMVLVVGEDLDYITALKESILEFGYECHIANSSKEGLQKAFDCSPDLIIYYTENQYFRSFDFFNILRESSLTYDIPFVMIAENISKEELQFALEIGVDGVFEKVLRLADMQRIVDGRIKKYVRIKRESEKDFLRSFDLTLSPVVIYNADFKVVSSNELFSKIFEIDESKPIWENLGLDKDLFVRQSYKVFANYDGQESFSHYIVVNGVEEKYNIVLSNLNAIFAKRCVLMVFNSECLESGSVSSDAEKRQLTSSRTGSDLIGNRIKFTKRQQEVLELSILGLPMKLIADELFISEKTVEKYRANLMEKTGAKNIIELVIFAIKNKYVDV